MSFQNAIQVGYVLDHEKPREVKTASFSVDGQGSAEVIAAVAGKKLRVIYMLLGAETTLGELQFRSAAADIGPLFYVSIIASSQPFPLAPVWLETVAGEALNADNDAASGTAGGLVGYIEVD